MHHLVRMLSPLLLLWMALPAAAAEAPNSTPASPDDLAKIQQQVQKVVADAKAATVGIINGGAQGSGVIVGEEGYVLTAGHVARRPGRTVTLVLPDGRKLKGKTLGINRGIDSGLIQITEEGEWPHVEMGKLENVEPGDWCVSLGHPGGYRSNRPPVVRLGRVIEVRSGFVRTDCTLIGGDSGGPLFDLEGKVIGIHSRISGPTSANFHVPIDTYHETWDRLAKAEMWGEVRGRPRGPMLGIVGGTHEKGCLIREVLPGSPAAKAELQPDDIIATFDSQEVKGIRGLVELIAKKKAGDEVELEIVRGEETVTCKVKLAKR